MRTCDARLASVFALLARVCFLFLAHVSGQAWGARIIEGTVAQPDYAITGQVSMVTLSAAIAPDQALLRESIFVVRYDETNRPLAVLGRLYDDGTHGDPVAGDNIFTGQITFNEPVARTEILRVSAAYRGVLTRLISDPIRIDIVTLPTSHDYNTTLGLNGSTSEYLRQLVAQYGVHAARDHLLQYLLAQPIVKFAGVSPDAQTIWVQYKNGLSSAIYVNDEGTWGAPASSGIVFSPVSQLAEPELISVRSKWKESTEIDLAPIKRDTEVTVDFLKTLNRYGAISLATHGGLDRDGQVTFQTGERANTVLVDFTEVPVTHVVDWMRGRLTLGADNYWLIRPSFISNYGGKFPNSIIYLSVCHSMDNSSLSDALLKKGASTVFGWQNSVSVSFAKATKDRLMIEMINLGKTAGDALNSVPTTDTSTNPRAVLKMTGSAETSFPAILDPGQGQRLIYGGISGKVVSMQGSASGVSVGDTIAVRFQYVPSTVDPRMNTDCSQGYSYPRYAFPASNPLNKIEATVGNQTIQHTSYGYSPQICASPRVYVRNSELYYGQPQYSSEYSVGGFGDPYPPSFISIFFEERSFDPKLLSTAELPASRDEFTFCAPPLPLSQVACIYAIQLALPNGTRVYGEADVSTFFLGNTPH